MIMYCLVRAITHPVYRSMSQPSNPFTFSHNFHPVWSYVNPAPPFPRSKSPRALKCVARKADNLTAICGPIV
jgi:hypothetical protein